MPLLEAYSPEACVGPPYMPHQSLYLSCAARRCVEGGAPGMMGSLRHLRAGEVPYSTRGMLTTARIPFTSPSLVPISHGFCSFVTCFMS